MTGRIGPSVGRTDILHQLLDYTTSTFYPEVCRACVYVHAHGTLGARTLTCET